MGAPAAASEINQFFVIHRQKMAYNGLKNINQIPRIWHMGKASNIFDYELKH